MRKDVGYSRGIAVDAGNAVDWDHPLNVGRSCWYVAPPGIPTGGRLNDITGKASSGTFANGPKWAPSNSGISGILFDDASSQSVSLPSSICPVGASPFSILLTYRLSKLPPSLSAVAFGIGVSPTSNRAVAIIVNTTGRPEVDVAAVGPTVGVAARVGAFTRVCATYDGTTLSFYQDGIFRNSNSRSLNITATSLSLGSNQYYAPGLMFFPGVISDFTTYSTRCLTRNDVRQDFLYQSSGYAAPDSPLRWFSSRSYSLPGGGSDAVGTATGTSAASGVGSSAAASVANTSGTGTVSGVGAASSASVASTAGTSSTSGIGAGSAAGVASADGTSTVSGVGISASAGVASASGTATVSGVGLSSSASVGSAAGTSTASAVGASSGSGSVATATGTSTASAVSASAVAAIFSAVGTCTVNGISPSASFSQADPASFFTMSDGISSIGGGDRPSTISVSSGFSFFGM